MANPLSQFTSKDLSLGDVASGAVENFVPSAKQFGADMAQILTNPVETAEGLGRVGLGLIQLIIPGEQGDEETARQVGKFFADRYGGWEAIKRTIASDPVGFLADASTVLTGGGAAIARAPSLAGRLGRVAQQAGRAVEPAGLAVKGAKQVGRALGPVAAGLAGMTTGTGARAIKTAASSGVAGGDLAARFRDSMRGKTPMSDVVDEARTAVSNLYQKRGQQYKSDMAAVDGDPAILDFGDVDAALAEVSGVQNFKGIPTSRSTEGVRGRIAEIADEWRELDPSEYHTVEGFDALKQSFGDVLDTAEYGSPSWKVANQAYQSVKQSITRQAPQYADAMKGYEQATSVLKELQGELSLGRTSSTAASLRKLQSIIRDDVSSAFGRRAELGDVLEGAGARGLTQSIAGHAMQSPLPRGLRGPVVGGGTVSGLGLAGGLNPGTAASMAAMAAASSPRVVGEIAHAGGRVAGPVSRVAAQVPAIAPELLQAAFQAGRTSDPSLEERKPMTVLDKLLQEGEARRRNGQRYQ